MFLFCLQRVDAGQMEMSGYRSAVVEDKGYRPSSTSREDRDESPETIFVFVLGPPAAFTGINDDIVVCSLPKRNEDRH